LKEEHVKICIVGAGAVGGHIAGRISAANSDVEVSVLARGAHLEAIRDNGLRVHIADGLLESRPLASDDPRELGPQDVVIVAVKAPSLPSVVQPVVSLLHPATSVVFVGNGIPWWYFADHGGEMDGTRLTPLDPGGLLWDAIGPERTVGGVAYTACSVLQPGVIKAPNRANRLVLGRPDGALDGGVDGLSRRFLNSGLEVSTTSRIREAIWTKLLMNMVGGSLAILTASPMGDVLDDVNALAFASRMAAEGASVAAALGIHIPDPTQGLNKLAESTHLQSIAQDLAAGRAMEIDAMFQIPLQMARSMGVATPHLDLILALATQRARAAGLY
jgi:2-dehydropantoate 2-reductase